MVACLTECSEPSSSLFWRASLVPIGYSGSHCNKILKLWPLYSFVVYVDIPLDSEMWEEKCNIRRGEVVVSSLYWLFRKIFETFRPYFPKFVCSAFSELNLESKRKMKKCQCLQCLGIAALASVDRETQLELSTTFAMFHRVRIFAYQTVNHLWFLRTSIPISCLLPSLA